MFSTSAIDKCIKYYNRQAGGFSDTEKVVSLAREEKELLLTKLEEYKTLLKEIEWVMDEECGWYYCPVCERAKDSKHSDDCKLYELIK